MKTMTFSGRTMREAIAQAKARFGGDVDILDSDAVGDEVQVTVVVPMARSARRRRALEQVSASINALAASGRTAANGTDSRTASVESRPTAPTVAATPANAVTAAPAVSEAALASTEKSSSAPASEVVKEAGPAVEAPDVTAVTDAPKAAGKTAADATAEPSAPRKKGRKRRTAAQEESAAPAVPVAANADEINPPTVTALEAPEVVAAAMAGDAPLPQYLSAAGADLKLAAANDAVVTEPLPQVKAPEAQGELSTLEFQRLRQQQQAEKAGGAARPGEAAGADTASRNLADDRAQASSTEDVTDGSASSVPVTPLPDFAALLQQQRQGIPIDLSALQMPGSTSTAAGQNGFLGGAVMPGTAAGAASGSAAPGSVTGIPQATADGTVAAPSMQASQGGAQPQAAITNAQAAAEHARTHPRSRLWQMVDSARRMLGIGRRRRLWHEMEEAGAATEGQGQAEAALSGFGTSSPLSLSSTLAGPATDWPVLSLPSDMTVAGTAEDAREAWATSGMGWFEATRRRPGQMRLLRNLLGCHFSPMLARTLVELLPSDYADAQADEWLRQMLMRALAGVNQGVGLTLGEDRTLFDAGGVFALIGPTGVGKTTSIAKIAAHHVLRHGPRSLALITADVYRIGAQEQLRAFGRMLGVPVQVAQDREVLQRLLKEHEGCRLVLIDTAGIGQRDDRVGQLTSALEVSQVRRVLVMNAAAQPGSLEEVLGAFGARDTAGVLLSKVDEAVGLGACLDALVRHRLPLLGYADGQRVPEDYHAVNFGRLVEMALDRQTVTRFPALSMTDNELRNLFEGSHV
jgi:GTP-binding signal recognition particle SRP54 G-domain